MKESNYNFFVKYEPDKLEDSIPKGNFSWFEESPVHILTNWENPLKKQ